MIHNQTQFSLLQNVLTQQIWCNKNCKFFYKNLGRNSSMVSKKTKKVVKKQDYPVPVKWFVI